MTQKNIVAINASKSQGNFFLTGCFCVRSAATSDAPKRATTLCNAPIAMNQTKSGVFTKPPDHRLAHETNEASTNERELTLVPPPLGANLGGIFFALAWEFPERSHDLHAPLDDVHPPQETVSRLNAYRSCGANTASA